MELVGIYNIAKSIQPFIRGNGTITPEGVYKIIMTNSHISFIKDVISPTNIPVLVFVAFEIANGNNDEKIVGKVKNNIFAFNTYEFGNTINDVECGECGGAGENSCDYCGGNGYVTCDECGGDGEVDCDECGGEGWVSGDDDDYVQCEECDGKSKVDCGDCSGEGTIDCNYCSNGYTSCDDCDGTGNKEIVDVVPFTILQCVSYDLKLRDKLELHITRNEDIDETFNDKTLIIYTKEYQANEGESEDVNLQYANKNYVGDVIDIDNSTITMRRNELFISDLSYLEERFQK